MSTTSDIKKGWLGRKSSQEEAGQGVDESPTRPLSGEDQAYLKDMGEKRVEVAHRNSEKLARQAGHRGESLVGDGFDAEREQDRLENEQIAREREAQKARDEPSPQEEAEVPADMDELHEVSLQEQQRRRREDEASKAPGAIGDAVPGSSTPMADKTLADFKEKSAQERTQGQEGRSR